MRMGDLFDCSADEGVRNFYAGDDSFYYGC